MLNANYVKDIADFCRRNTEISARWGQPSFIFSDEELENISNFLIWRNTNKAGNIVRVDWDVCSVFSNDLALLKTLEAVAPLGIAFTEVQLQQDPTIKYSSNPKHAFRIYLKERRSDDHLQKELNDFLMQYSKSLFPCKALLDWARFDRSLSPLYSYWRYEWIKAFFFIEFDDPAMLTIIKLVFPDVMFGKLYKLEKRKK